MRTTFTAIHLKSNGQELTAKFSLPENYHQAVRLAAESAMEKAHGIRKVHGWSIEPKPGSNFWDFIEKYRSGMVA